MAGCLGKHGYGDLSRTCLRSYTVLASSHLDQQLLDLSFKLVSLLTEVGELTILRAEVCDGLAATLVFHLVMLVHRF